MRGFGRLITVNSDKKPKEFVRGDQLTPQYLFELGMCLCNRCGKLHCVDYAYCNDCCREIIIFLVPGEKPDDAKINDLVTDWRKRVGK